MKWYLQHTYLIGPSAGTHDHVGPFETRLLAILHRGAYGPVHAELVAFDDDPTPCMSVGEHVLYVMARL